ASHLKAKIAKLKTEGDPELLTVARQQMAELQADNAKLRSELGIVCLIKEQKADDELLSLMRENEALKAELPSKSIADYKQSVGFEWGLRRMGQVSYEYGTRSPWHVSRLGIPTWRSTSTPSPRSPKTARC
ncbi:hypothetical protein BHE74_00010839, partial [Ensete ventricosum]